MKIEDNVAVVTGAASGIGRAVAEKLIDLGIQAVGLVDLSEEVQTTADQMNGQTGKPVAFPFIGNTIDQGFIRQVYSEMEKKAGLVRILVPAAGITRDGLSVKIDKETGEVQVYPMEKFKLVLDVNLVAPLYWAMELMAGIARDRRDKGLKRWDPSEGIQGVTVFIGSVSSQGNKGQVSYSATKSGLIGAASSMMSEGMFYGVRCGIVHPGFTNTPMVQALGEEHIQKYVAPSTQLRRLIEPKEIAEAIAFMVQNPVVTREIWADAGWRPAP